MTEAGSNKADTGFSLRIQQLGKVVDTGAQRLTILQAVNIEIKSGESVAIVGASGSGKSTLLGIMAGLDLPTTGSVELLGHELGALDEDQRAAVRAQGVSFVFQNFQLLPGLTALENVMLPLEIRGVRNARDEARQLLTQVGLGERQLHYPTQLSGGEQQRVAIARALVHDPILLLADEPTGNLDEGTGDDVLKLLLELTRGAGKTLIMATHDPQIAQYADQVLYLEHGKLISHTGGD